MPLAPRRIIVSRTDRLGDVVLTLPLFGLLRERYPDAELVALVRRYAHPIVAASRHVHRVVDWPAHDEATDADRVTLLRDLDADTILHLFPRREVAAAARDAGIARRIGTARRWFHWVTCTERVNVSRKRSALHEAQLNLRVAAPLVGDQETSLAALVPHIGLTRTAPLEPSWAARLDRMRTIVLLQPLTGGTVPPWPLERWSALIAQLDPAEFQVWITGSETEAETLRPWLDSLPPHVQDAAGQSLGELLSFTRSSHAFVGASTGPLHIAAGLGVHTIGLYPARETGLLGRWAPLGADTRVLMPDHAPAAEGPASLGIEGISVAEVRSALDQASRTRVRKPG